MGGEGLGGREHRRAWKGAGLTRAARARFLPGFVSMDTLAMQIESRLRLALADFAEADARVLPANDPRHGDYQSNVAMGLAKLRKTPPRQLAQEIAARFDPAGLCEAPEVAGAGFINFRITPEALGVQATAIRRDARLGVPEPKAVRTMVVDFSSPNVAKAMHVGHIRSTILGDCLARIGEFLGHRVVRDNHIGDWGTQFGMLLVGWKTALDRARLVAEPIGEMERLYKLVNAQCEADEGVRDAARAELVKLQAGDEENLGIWREMIQLSQAQFDDIYARLGVRFDVTLGESFYNPWLKGVVAGLRERGIARESEGAICVFSDRTLPEKEDPFLIQRDGQWVDIPALIQKADGAANYTTTDLATLDYRLREWAPDDIVYVTDGRQQHHFRQLFAIFRRWKPEVKTRLAHVWFGSILGEDGRPFKTRSGDTVRLADLLDEAQERALALVTEKNRELPEAERREIARQVGIGAVKYADLLPNRQSDYTFSWAKMLSFQGNTAPYLQYSHVRICSIFRKAGAGSTAAHAEAGAAAIEAIEPAERVLALKLCQFGEVVPQILEDFRPNLLANYLYELAAAFHSFFEACPVLKSEGATRASRLAMCDLTARILSRGLHLLGIEAPERM
jgi:arginyl-tRNA synthetase